MWTLSTYVMLRTISTRSAVGMIGSTLLHEPEHLVADDTRDEEVAVLLGMPKDVEVSDVKEVECPGGIADAYSHDSPM